MYTYTSTKPEEKKDRTAQPDRATLFVAIAYHTAYSLLCKNLIILFCSVQKGYCSTTVLKYIEDLGSVSAKTTSLRKMRHIRTKSDLVSNPHVSKKGSTGVGVRLGRSCTAINYGEMNQRKFQDPEIPLSPLPVLQIVSCQSAKIKKSRKARKKMGLGGTKRARESDADLKSGEYRR